MEKNINYTQDDELKIQISPSMNVTVFSVIISVLCLSVLIIIIYKLAYINKQGILQTILALLAAFLLLVYFFKYLQKAFASELIIMSNVDVLLMDKGPIMKSEIRLRLNEIKSLGLAGKQNTKGPKKGLQLLYRGRWINFGKNILPEEGKEIIERMQSFSNNSIDMSNDESSK